MRKKIIGEYGVIEAIVSVGVFSFLCYFNWLFFIKVIAGETIEQHILFMVIFIDLVCLVIMTLPYLTKKSENVSNEKIKIFLDLPEKDSRFTFSTISGFLSDQALASFLATVLIFTGKEVLATYGGAIAAVYVVFLFVFAIVLGSVSLIRFITHFTKHHGAFYALASALSAGVMFAFFNVGLKMAA
ncbi:hypothetical protein L2725_09695 [Shewanella corallii]|uniref:Uncharacterized protein n=1 Tax=Shewanella corallii TaxID=560080 RepID=A0ABT0N6I9_9GAMM|nr:hypothetical protein [Shewanella corallii]MCL2914061.1 hypothetical protein [Shewanella corallii]